jgi:predicted nucleic acid-binding protein
VVSGAISDDRAADARVDFADLTIVRYPHISLADRMWELRQNVTAYDAAFLALAETLGAPLITCDIRLSRVRGYTAAVELFRGAATSPPAERP